MDTVSTIININSHGNIALSMLQSEGEDSDIGSAEGVEIDGGMGTVNLALNSLFNLEPRTTGMSK